MYLSTYLSLNLVLIFPDCVKHLYVDQQYHEHSDAHHPQCSLKQDLMSMISSLDYKYYYLTLAIIRADSAIIMNGTLTQQISSLEEGK